MATFSKEILSGSSNGRGILITATASSGTLIHTAVSGTSDKDEIWLYCVNTSSSGVKLTIEWGETTAPDGNIEQTIPAESGLFSVIPGLVLQNSLVVRAFAGTGSVLVMHGYVHRITT